MAYKFKHPVQTTWWSMFLLSIVIFSLGLVLFLDEAWMFNPDFGHAGWLLGDWSWMHLEPFHHWMLGLVLMILSMVSMWYVILREMN